MPPSHSTPPASDLSEHSEFGKHLDRWLQKAQIRSWTTLGKQADLSRYRIRQLRRGQIERWPAATLASLCQALHITPNELFIAAGLFSAASHQSTPQPDSIPPATAPANTAPASEDAYALSILTQLEPFLRQWPTAVYAARHHNLPLEHLLKVLSTWDVLLTHLGLETLGQVGETVPFDPAWQQPLAEETYKNGTPVSIRYVGYRRKEKLWLRAQVRSS